MVTHLECEVKWALGNIATIKTSESSGIPAELFQILKDDAVKVMHSVCQQSWKTLQWPLQWRRKWQPTPVFSPGESQGWGSLVGCRLCGCTESDTTEVTAAAATVATGMGKVSYHSNLKEGKCQRMFKVLHNCAHFTC